MYDIYLAVDQSFYDTCAVKNNFQVYNSHHAYTLLA